MTDTNDDPRDAVHTAFGSLSSCDRETAAPLGQQQQQQQPHAVDRLPMLSSPLATARPLRVNVTVRVGRLLSFTALVVVVMFLTIGALSEGFELDRFDWVDKTPEQRQRSIDNYNSFSGGIASIFIGPLESLAMRMLQAEPHWSTQLVMLVLTAGLGFLLNNGLAAMNVQIRPLESEATTLSARDLVLSSTWNGSVGFETLVPETTEANAVTNTLLRSFLSPRVWSPTERQCSGQPRSALDIDMVAFGIPPRDWQSRLIPNALPHQTQRFEFDTSGWIGPPGVLPVDPATAAELMIHAALWMNTSRSLTVWLQEQNATMPLQDGQAVPVAKRLGLVSVNSRSVEAESETFLKGASRLLQTLNSSRGSRRAVELSRLELNRFIAFDAVTVETFSAPSTLTFDPSDRCGPWSLALCVVPLPSKLQSPHVLAAASCLNDDGREELSVQRSRDASSSRLQIVCLATSKTSMLVISQSQFLQADELYANDSRRAAITGLRSVTRVTVGRLSWSLQDLAPVVNASCGMPSCQGLWLSLPTGKGWRLEQRLLIGADHLPLQLLQPLNYDNLKASNVLPLAVLRPARTSDEMNGVLLPHNIKSIRWNASQISGVNCDAAVEDQLTSSLRNHLYMEHGLQPSYTAAAMFLFQDAAVKTAPTATTPGRPMPNEACTGDGTAAKMVVWISIPKQNAIMTLVGCGLLAILVIATSVVSCYHEKRGSGALRDLTAPAEIAQLLLNESRYPFTLLDRRVVLDANNSNSSDATADKNDEPLERFGIQSLTLSHCRTRDCVMTSHGYTSAPNFT